MLRGRSSTGHWWASSWMRRTPQALGLIDAEMLGWEVYKKKPTEFVLAVTGDSEACMSFQPQTSEEWVRPVWPAQDSHQQMMLHLDVEGELEVAVAHAVELGATVADHQQQENVRVLDDPAGHPFCLYVGD